MSDNVFHVVFTRPGPQRREEVLTKEKSHSLMRRKSRPAQFNLLVAGHSRTGKTDFIHTLYETLKVVKFVEDNEGLNISDTSTLFPVDVSQPTPSSAGIECHPDPELSHKITLRLIDCPGLSIPSGLHKAPLSSKEALDRYATAWLGVINKYITNHFVNKLDKETKIKRNPREKDNLVHACLYLLSPDIVLANQGLSSMDIIALKGLCEKVNVIPCLAKSDLVTCKELKQIKEYLNASFSNEDLDIYKFEAYDGDEDDEDGGQEESSKNEQINFNEKVPFCLVNSEEMISASDAVQREMGFMVDGKKVLGRQFLWNTIEVENPKHSDFNILKMALFDLYLEDLKESTVYLYEKWRTEFMKSNRRSVYFPPDLAPLVVGISLDQPTEKTQEKIAPKAETVLASPAPSQAAIEE